MEGSVRGLTTVVLAAVLLALLFGGSLIGGKAWGVTGGHGQEAKPAGATPPENFRSPEH